MQIIVNDLAINVTLEGTELCLFFEKDFMDESGKPVKLGIRVHTGDGRATLDHETILQLTAPPIDDPASVRYRVSPEASWWDMPSDAELAPNRGMLLLANRGMLLLADGMQIEVISTRN